MKIIKPSCGGHDGSSFREILDIWKEKGICEVVNGIKPNTFYMEETQLIESRPWIDSIGHIMLYDQPILDKIHEKLNWELALFSNEVPINNTNEKFFKNWNDKGYCSTWTFWPNHPKEHEKVRKEGIPTYNERTHKSCFIGSLTPGYRHNYVEWGKHIENFWMGSGNQRLMSQNEYLNFIKKHKFGLCLRGVGPKCLRDVELIGMGTVPIFTPGVSTDYYNKLEKNKHFLYAETPEEIESLIKDCTQEQWEYMSSECIKWFDNNSSPEGVYDVTCKIIKEYEDKNKL